MEASWSSQEDIKLATHREGAKKGNVVQTQMQLVTNKLNLCGKECGKKKIFYCLYSKARRSGGQARGIGILRDEEKIDLF